jgi:hypothetical protein
MIACAKPQEGSVSPSSPHEQEGGEPPTLAAHMANNAAAAGAPERHPCCFGSALTVVPFAFFKDVVSSVLWPVQAIRRSPDR